MKYAAWAWGTASENFITWVYFERPDKYYTHKITFEFRYYKNHVIFSSSSSLGYRTHSPYSHQKYCPRRRLTGLVVGQYS